MCFVVYKEGDHFSLVHKCPHFRLHSKKCGSQKKGKCKNIRCFEDKLELLRSPVGWGRESGVGSEGGVGRGVGRCSLPKKMCRHNLYSLDVMVTMGLLKMLEVLESFLDQCFCGLFRIKSGVTRQL